MPSSRAQPDRQRRPLTVTTLLLVIAFVVVGIGTPLLGTKVFAATDLLLDRAPWNAAEPTDFRPQNGYVSDTVDSVLPGGNAFGERARDGDYAMWWGESSGGSQLGSLPNYAVLSPVSLPYLLLPVELAPAYVKLLELVVAVGGMVLFLRRLKLSPPAALLGGLVFASSGFMVAWTNWPQTRTAAFVPALFWAVERLVQLRRPREVVLVAAVVACLLVGGFPYVAALALGVAAVYLVVRLLAGERPGGARGVVGTGIAAAAGVGLGAVLVGFQLVGFVDERLSVLNGARTQDAGSHSPMSSFSSALVPQGLGGTNSNVSDVLWFGQEHVVEAMAYVGVAGAVLALVGAVARRRPGVPPLVPALFAVGALVTFVLVFVGGPLLEALQQLPLLSSNRIGRARVVLGFFLAVLAALGLDALLRRPAAGFTSGARRVTWWVVAAVGVGIGVAAFGRGVLAGRDLAGSLGQGAWFDDRLVWPAVLLVLTLAAVVVARTAGGWVRSAACAGLVALVLVQALGVVLPYWARVDRDHFYPVTPTHAFLQANLGHDRLVSMGSTMNGTEAFYDLRSVGGRVFVDDQYGYLMRAGCPRCFVTPTYVTPEPFFDAFDPDVLDRLAARYSVWNPDRPLAGEVELVGGATETVVLEPGVPVTVEVGPGGLRGVGIEVLAEAYPTDQWSALEIVVRDAGGDVLLESERRLFLGVRPGPVTAALAEAEVEDAAEVEITLRSDLPIEVAGESGVPQVLLVRPSDDGLRIVAAGPATVYERLTALPRIRWAQTSVVEPDPERAAQLVADGTDADVVLATGSRLDVQPGPAELEVLEDSGDTIEVAVSAEGGGGHLVVADALLSRWEATLDGEPAAMVAADAAFVAVEVPPGEHVVRFTYAAPAGGAGYALSGLGVLGAVALLGLDLARRRRRSDGSGGSAVVARTGSVSGARDQETGASPHDDGSGSSSGSTSAAPTGPTPEARDPEPAAPLHEASPLEAEPSRPDSGRPADHER